MENTEVITKEVENPTPMIQQHGDIMLVGLEHEIAPDHTFIIHKNTLCVGTETPKGHEDLYEVELPHPGELLGIASTLSEEVSSGCVAESVEGYFKNYGCKDFESYTLTTARTSLRSLCTSYGMDWENCLIVKIKE